jgi:hypothetical protein
LYFVHTVTKLSIVFVAFSCAIQATRMNVILGPFDDAVFVVDQVVLGEGCRCRSSRT